MTLLAQLALVYWQPDFEPGQARQLYAQYLTDLREYALSDIRDAIEKYRQSAEKFYPKPGQLRSLIETVPAWVITSKAKHIGERRRAAVAELAGVAARIERANPVSPMAQIGA